MTKWSAIIGVVVVVAGAAWATVHEFAANEPIQYFAERPQHLIWVAALAVCGGLAAHAYTQISPRARRQVRLFGWGASACIYTVLWLHVLYASVSLSSVTIEYDSMIWLLLALALTAIMGVFLWWQFFKEWRMKTSSNQKVKAAGGSPTATGQWPVPPRS